MRHRKLAATALAALATASAVPALWYRARSAPRRARHRAFQAQVAQGLSDQQLRATLAQFTDNWRESRAAVMQDLDFEKARRALRGAKEQAVEQLPELAQLFAERARQAGAVLYEAATAQDANSYILDLARRRSVKSIVKSKSMVSEEIELNAYLARAGLKVTETDLGEWIIQLAGQKPSHMVMPAIHLNRTQVAALFTAAVGRPVPADDIGGMVLTARQELRQAFLEAEMAISGANFAIAESGTLAILTNEGNGRLATSAPPVHVALVGYEKLVPAFEDAVAALRLLGRSATAQRITSYVTFLTGPATPEREMHIILLDNGRLGAREDEEFRESLYCIKCAACLNICPVYRETGGHAFSYIYMGPIGAVITSFLHGVDKAAEMAELCTLCNACREICPVGIDIPRMIVAARQRATEANGLPLSTALLTRGLLKDRTRFYAGLKLASLAQTPVSGGSRTIRAVPLFRGLTRHRSLPALVSRPLHERQTSYPARGRRRGKAVFFAGCLIDFLYPEQGEAAMALLSRGGVEVVLTEGQVCCGVPALYNGDRPTALDLGRQCIDNLLGEDPDWVITACASCGYAFRREYPELFAGDSLWEKRAATLAKQAREVSEFLANEVGMEAWQEVQKAALPPITYHDTCHMRPGLGTCQGPRRLLRELAGAELVEMKDCNVCCGFGGSFSLKYPEVSTRIVERKLANAEASGARIVATDNPGCIMHMRGALDKRNSDLRVMHTAEILALALG